MSRLLVALTQTINAYDEMPMTVDGLDALADRLPEIREANLAHHVDLVKKAADAGADVVGLGELFAGPYFALERRELWKGLAEDLKTGPTTVCMQRTAKKYGVAIIAPLYERTSDAMYNSAAVIDENGRLLGAYRKTHIPSGRNEIGPFSEIFYYAKSSGSELFVPEKIADPHPFFPVFHLRGARIGVAICYDRHFEGSIGSLARGGAQIVFVPAVTFGKKSQRMWRSEFATDAMRHHLYIAGSNRLGSEQPWSVPYFGDSHVVGPNGSLSNVSDDPALVISAVDLDALSEPDPAGWDLARDRRGDIYR